jgi:hypothetical protein
MRNVPSSLGIRVHFPRRGERISCLFETGHNGLMTVKSVLTVVPMIDSRWSRYRGRILSAATWWRCGDGSSSWGWHGLLLLLLLLVLSLLIQHSLLAVILL